MARKKKQQNPMDDFLKPPHTSRRCGAKLRGREDRCQRWATIGFPRCRLHGGVAGSGRPPTHGRYTRERKHQWALMRALLRLLKANTARGTCRQ